MGTVTSQIISLTVVYSTVYLGSDQRKHQSSASLAFVRGIHRGPVNSPHKWPVTRKMFPFDDVIMHGALSDNHGIFAHMPRPPRPTKMYTTLVPIFAKRGVLFQWEARIREIKKKGNFASMSPRNFWKRVKFGMYLLSSVCSTYLNCYAWMYLKS